MASPCGVGCLARTTGTLPPPRAGSSAPFSSSSPFPGAQAARLVLLVGDERARPAFPCQPSAMDKQLQVVPAELFIRWLHMRREQGQPQKFYTNLDIHLQCQIRGPRTLGAHLVLSIFTRQYSHNLHRDLCLLPTSKQ